MNTSTRIFGTIAITLFLALAAFAAPGDEVPLTSLNVTGGKALAIAQDVTVAAVPQKNAYCIPAGYYESEYGLARKYDWFVCNIGMSDDAPTDCRLNVRIYVDGELVLTQEVFALKDTKTLKVNVKDKMRIKFFVVDNGHNAKLIIYTNPRVITGEVKPTPTVIDGGGTAGTAIANSPATFVTDPNDLDKLAIALRKRVDGKAELKDNIAKGFTAVMTFNLIDIPSQSVAQNVAEDLTTKLINADFPLVERGQLDKALKELKIMDSGLIDQATALKLGQMTGCNYILVGSVSDRGQFIVINSRILETATGKAIAAESVECRKIAIERK